MRTDHADNETKQPDLARKYLYRVTTSRCFRRSERLQRFLSYLAERSLSTDASDVKEYTIAVDVYDKGESFDPRRDPIVRVEARRLRSKLREYYAAEGADDSITLDLPVGSYVLLFHHRSPERAARRPESAVAEQCVLVQPFSALGESRVLDRLRDGLTTELLNKLSRVEFLRILLWNRSRSTVARTHDSSAEGAGRKADWIVEGVLIGQRSCVRVSVRLVSARDGELQWVRRWDLPADPALAFLENFAGTVADSVRLSLSATPISNAAN